MELFFDFIQTLGSWVVNTSRRILHIGVDALGLLAHSLQGCIQIFQREKLMLFQIDDDIWC